MSDDYVYRTIESRVLTVLAAAVESHPERERIDEITSTSPGIDIRRDEDGLLVFFLHAEPELIVCKVRPTALTGLDGSPGNN